MAVLGKLSQGIRAGMVKRELSSQREGLIDSHGTEQGPGFRCWWYDRERGTHTLWQLNFIGNNHTGALLWRQERSS